MLRELIHEVDAVQLTEVRIFERVLRLRSPLLTSRGALQERESLLLEVTGISGGAQVRGIGEAAPLPGWSADRYRDARFDALRLREAVSAGAMTSGAEAMRAARPPSLRFALESALLDIVAKGAAKPIRRLLDPEAPNSIALNGVVGLEHPEEAARLAVGMFEEGFETLKLKVGDEQDIERVRAVRAAVGPQVRLRLDANGAWTPAEALCRLERLAAHDIELVEQPCATLDDLLHVAQRATIVVAADELCADLAVARRLVEERLVGAVILKPALLGAWRDLVPIVDAAHRNDVAVVFTSAIDGVVGRWAVAQFAAALLDANTACGLATGHLLEGDVAVEEVIRQGRLHLGSTSGIGFQLQLVDPVP